MYFMRKCGPHYKWHLNLYLISPTSFLVRLVCLPIRYCMNVGNPFMTSEEMSKNKVVYMLESNFKQSSVNKMQVQS